MADTFAVRGYAAVTQSPVATPSGDFSVFATLEESLGLTKKHATTVSLDADPVEVVSLGDVANAHVVVISNVVGGEIKVRLTSAAGTTQVIPVSKLLILISTVSPIT